ncbi:hypothetical protein MASSI9I_100097 [Massilia sp. 9I]|nr:hypothetical protein MASSI9I_100097 [Massilia sp. 9I]
MLKTHTRSLFRLLIPGLLAGGLCGAAVGMGLVDPGVGIPAAVCVALIVGLSIRRLRRRLKEASDR